MKKLTLITFMLISLAAQCQDPDTLTYYTTEYVDSLHVRIDSLEIWNERQRQLLSVYQAGKDTIPFYLDTVLLDIANPDMSARLRVIKRGDNYNIIPIYE